MGKPNAITRVFVRWRQEDKSEREREVERCYTADFEDGEWGCQSRNARSLQKLERGMYSSLEPLEWKQPCRYLEFISLKLVLAF